MTDTRDTANSGDSAKSVSDERLNADLEKRINALPPHLRNRLREKLETSGARPKRSTIQPRQEPNVLLSLGQQRLWIQHRLHPDSSAYHIAQLHSLRGELNSTALRAALSQLVARQSALRTRIVPPSKKSANQPEICLDPTWGTEATPGFLLIDQPEVASTARNTFAEAWAAQEIALPIDLESGPVFRARVLRFAQDHHALLLVTHHIAADGWSIGVLWKELGILYAKITASQATADALPKLPVTYADFAFWEQAKATGPELTSSENFWRENLQGAPELLALPTDRARSTADSRRGAQTELQLPAGLTHSLRQLARGHSVTLFAVLVAGFAVLLSRLALTKDVVMGTPLAGRDQAETQDLIGFFVRNLVLRIDLAEDPSVGRLLKHTQSTLGSAIDHSNLPFEKLVEILQPARSLSHTPLFQVSIALQEFSTQSEKLRLDGLTVTRLPLHNSDAKFDLAVSIQQNSATESGSTQVVADFDLDLFDQATVRNWLSVYQTLLEEMAVGAHKPVSQLRSLKPPSIDNRPSQHTPNLDVATRFEAIAAELPSAPAIIDDINALSYQQLNSAANALALRLRAGGVTAGNIIGFQLQTRKSAIVAMLAILKCAAAYLPIDPAYPAARRRFMLENSRAKLIITDGQSADSVTDSHPSIVFNADAFCKDPGNPVRPTDPERLAYVIYTSGSTGMPKGAMIPHRGITSLVLDTNYLPFGPGQRILQIASLAFDAATFEIWGSLLHGGACVLYSHRHIEPGPLSTLIADHKVTSGFLNAALFNTLIDTAPETLAPMTNLLIGGESLSPPHVANAQRLLPHLQLSNVYGPTETTTFATCYRIRTTVVETNSRIPIGRPINNRHVYVLDEANNPVAEGIPGELFIGGPGVALGYLGNPQLTNHAFSEIDLPSGRERLYRTGDLVRWLPGGLLDFLGRRDHQAKVRGYRVEPEELDHVLTTHPEVAEAASVVTKPTNADPQLISWVVAKPNKKADVGALKRWLTARLPAYQNPERIYVLSKLPLGASGKIDRIALENMWQEQIEQSAQPGTGGEQLSVTEHWLTTMLGQLLGIPPPAPGENFFDIGGHSLLAVRLVAEISTEFDIELPLSILFQTSSISELAKAVDSNTGKDTADWSVLVPIREGGDRPPLFLVHAVGGNVLGFSEFAKHLHPEQPLIGVQARGFLKGQTPHNNIREMARDYVRAILEQYPNPPYLLGGLSMGGVIAFEMAAQLADLGLTPSYLMIGDTLTKSGPQFKPLSWKASGLYYPLLAPGNVLRAFRQRLGRSKQVHNPRPTVNELHRQLLKAHRLALTNYVPGYYSGPITLIRGTATNRRILRLDAYFRDRSLGWSDLTSDTTHVEFLPGGHHDIFYNAGAPSFAATLDRTISHALERANSPQTTKTDESHG